MKNITVLGWYNHKNVGDEAYKLAFPIIFPNYDFHFTDSLAPDDKGASVVLGGGDVLQPYFYQQLEKVAKPKHALSVNFLKDETLPKPLQTFKQVYVRNFVNIAKLAWKGLTLGCLPDFTFILQPDAARGKKIIQDLFKKQGADLYEKVVIVVVNSYLTVGNENIKARDYATFDKFTWDMAQLMDETPASFLFLPFGTSKPHDDRITNSALYSRCKYWKKNVLSFEELTVQETLDVFAAADASLGSRLHASVFSCIGGTPFIDITHHDKTKLFLEFVNRPNWQVNYWRCNFDKLEDLLKQFLSQKNLRDDLKKIAAANRNLLLQANALISL